MHDYALSRSAGSDIQHIARESVKLWGLPRAEQYILELHQTLEMLAKFPHLGRDFGHLRRGYFRFEHRSHSIFYRKLLTGVLITRILHQKQQPSNYV